MLLVDVLLACHGKDSGDTAPEVFHPALDFLAPTDGSTVDAGDVQVSIDLHDFVIEAPESGQNLALPPALWLLESEASAHNESGTPAGYCELSLDGTVVTDMSTTQYTMTGVAAGAHTLVGHLLFADGDELETPVSETISFTAQ